MSDFLLSSERAFKYFLEHVDPNVVLEETFVPDLAAVADRLYDGRTEYWNDRRIAAERFHWQLEERNPWQPFSRRQLSTSLEDLDRIESAHRSNLSDAARRCHVPQRPHAA